MTTELGHLLAMSKHLIVRNKQDTTVFIYIIYIQHDRQSCLQYIWDNRASMTEYNRKTDFQHDVSDQRETEHFINHCVLYVIYDSWPDVMARDVYLDGNCEVNNKKLQMP